MKLTFEQWCKSVGLDTIRFGSDDMVNVKYLYDAFCANLDYINYLENKVKSVYNMSTDEYLKLDTKQ